MVNIRRWYMYLVSAISLQGVTWAVIALLRNLFITRLDPPPAAVAFQIAVILIGLPIFLGHWLWAQRLVGKGVEERGATLRRLYLYGMMAAYLGPFAANAFDLIGTLLRANSILLRRSDRLASGEAVAYHLLALVILGVLWFYHRWVALEDAQTIPEAGGAATVRRLYVLGFSAAGLVMTTMAVIHMIRWIMRQFGEVVVRSGGFDAGLATEATRLLIGLPLWFVFWFWAQKLFEGPSRAERESALRKLYLYGAVFIGVLSAVANTAAIVAGLFRRLLSLPPQGTIRTPLPIVIGMILVWALHAFLLRDDAKKITAAPRQAGMRRLYLYLVAAIGLSALLIGLSGDISVILRSVGDEFGTVLRDQLAWFTAAIVAGLPVWLLPWREAQQRALEAGPAGNNARHSIVRKGYLYFFLFIATMTVLSAVIFIVSGVLVWVLGGDAPTLSELGQAIAFSLIAVGVWLYHSILLRTDNRLLGREQDKRLEDLRLVVLDLNGRQFGRAVVDALKEETPTLKLEPIVLAQGNGNGDAAGEETRKPDKELVAQLAQAEVIVGPWEIALPSGAGGLVSLGVAQAVANSPARKLLIPTQGTGWEWVGVERSDVEELVRQSVHAIKQIAAGEPVKPDRPLGIGAIIAIVIGVLLLLIGLAIPLISFFAF